MSAAPAPRYDQGSGRAERCPECGAAWRLPGGTVRGRHAARSPSLVAAGGQRARVGEELTLTIGLEDREPPSFTAGMACYVGGFFIDGSAEPLGRVEQPRRRSTLAVQMRGLLRHRPSTAAPRVEVAMSRAGAVRVRLNLWLVYSPNALGAGPITWQSDGTPVVPGAALWSGRLDLEHTIHVDP